MASASPNHRMTTLERLSLTKGEEVTIYVGPEKKKYMLPKALLCAASPYFDRCFNGEFIEGFIQELTLEEDEVRHFEILLEFMYVGRVEKDALDLTSSYQGDNAKERGDQIADRCMDFIDYADKYDLKDAGMAIYKCLHDALSYSVDAIFPYPWVDQVHIEYFFRKFPAGSDFRVLITKAVVSHWAPTELYQFKIQEDEVYGYAQELLDQLRDCGIFSDHWRDPLTHVDRHGSQWRNY